MTSNLKLTDISTKEGQTGDIGFGVSIPQCADAVKERVFLMGNVGNFIFLIGRNCSLPPLLCGTSK